TSLLPKSDSIHIRKVCNDNLEQEFELIRAIVNDYLYVAMDTEFPGVVLRPVGSFQSPNDYHYQTLKDNVNLLKLIRLGLTLFDEKENLPTCRTDNDSIELLKQCGIDFRKNNEKGVDAAQFGELLMSSGIVLNDSVYWLLTCQDLPNTQSEFFKLTDMYFLMLYDIKHLMKFCNSLHGGLNKLAELLEVERVGNCHQAGSDSVLTSCTFRKLKDNFFRGSLEKYTGVLYDLGFENGQNTQ
ncbi:hypothetical protein EUGRSUZ_J03104, partial [Eucalyptus grandis]